MSSEYINVMDPSSNEAQGGDILMYKFGKMGHLSKQGRAIASRMPIVGPDGEDEQELRQGAREARAQLRREAAEERRI